MHFVAGKETNAMNLLRGGGSVYSLNTKILTMHLIYEQCGHVFPW